MWAEAAISSTVAGCAKCASIQETASATRCTPDFGSPICATRAPIDVRSNNDDFVDHERSKKRRVLRPVHQIHQSRHGLDDAVGRLPEESPRLFDGFGIPRGNTRVASSATRAGSRSTISVLIATGKPAQLAGHLGRALDNGVQPREASGVLAHLAMYAGWPSAVSALGVYDQVYTGRKVDPRNAAQHGAASCSFRLRRVTGTGDDRATWGDCAEVRRAH
jgi:alkylhydroperoxidase/carboxymuconolactone decarboxylase family protein YurZ